MAGVVGASFTAAPPAAPAPTRGRSAARGRRLALAADAVVCFYHAALWACAAAAAAVIVTRRACGKDSRAAAVAEVNSVASVSAMTLLHLASLLLYPWSPGILRTADAGEIGGDADATGLAATQRRRPGESTGARGRQDVRRISVPGCIFLAGCMLLVSSLVMLLLVPAKGSWMERVGSMLCDTGLFLHCVTYCFVKFPAVLDELSATCVKLKRGSTGLH